MIRSGCLKDSLNSNDYKEVINICKDTENVTKPTEKDICEIRKGIEFVKALLRKVSARKNPTAFLYLERILFCMQMKNAELGKVYNHVEYLHDFNNFNPSVRLSYLMSGFDLNEEFTNEADRERLRNSYRRTVTKGLPEEIDKKVLRRY